MHGCAYATNNTMIAHTTQATNPRSRPPPHRPQRGWPPPRPGAGGTGPVNCVYVGVGGVLAFVGSSQFHGSMCKHHKHTHQHPIHPPTYPPLPTPTSSGPWTAPAAASPPPAAPSGPAPVCACVCVSGQSHNRCARASDRNEGTKRTDRHTPIHTCGGGARRAGIGCCCCCMGGWAGGG